MLRVLQRWKGDELAPVLFHLEGVLDKDSIDPDAEIDNTWQLHSTITERNKVLC